MIKNFWIALTFMIIGQSVALTDVKANDVAKSGLNGPVKSVESIEYTPKLVQNEWVPGDINLITSRSFDSNGNMTLELLKDSKGNNIFSTKISVFDSSKNVEYISYTDGGEVEYKEKGKVKLDGEVLSMNTYDAEGKITSSVKALIDAEGKITKTSQYNENNIVISSKNYGYNSTGWLSFIKVEKVGEPNYVEFYDYTSRGELIEVKSVNLDGDVLNQILYSYNPNGKKRKVTIYPSLQDNKEHQVTTYNDEGETLESIYYSDTGEIIQKEVFTYNEYGVVEKFDVFHLFNNVLVNDYSLHYDEFGNEVNRITYDEKGIPASNIETIYIYDTERNWTQKTEKLNDEVTLIVKRDISYF